MIGLPLQTVAGDDISSEEFRGKRHHFSKREVGCVLVVIVAVILMALPLIKGMIEKSEDTACRENLKSIGQAALGYMADNSDRLPPVYNMNSDGTPAAILSGGKGYPVTWATQIHGYLSARANFLCRSATDKETVKTIAGKEGESVFKLSYGMYRGLSTVARIQIPHPETTVFVAETSNEGAEGSFDPMPFGPNIPDAFLIGWDDGNFDFTKKSSWVTRLAFRNVPSGYNGPDIKGRHKEHINAVTVDGAYRMLHAFEAKVEHDAARLTNTWWADPNLFH
jgi:hypothetical protein